MNKTQTFVLFFLLHLASIFAVFPESMIAAASSGHWLAIVIIFLGELLFLWFYLKALSLFPGKTVIEICIISLGKWGARLLFLPFICFLFMELILILYFQSTQIKVVLLQRTPISVISGLFVVLGLYGAWKGLAVIIRASISLFLLFMPFILFSMMISIENFSFNYIFPVWDTQMSFVFDPDFYVSAALLTSFLFLGMAPSPERISFGRVTIVVGIIFLFALASVYIPLLVFGQETTAHLQYPMLMASDTIDLEWVIFDWLPSFYVVSSSGLGVLKFTVFLWMLMKIVHQLFIPRLNSGWLLLCISVTLLLFCLRIPDIQAMHRYQYLHAYFCFFSILVFPIVTFLSGQWHRKKVSR